MKILLLFLTFLKIGFIGFGGGYGMLPIIESEIVGKNWLSKQEFWDVVAIAESTPGPIAVNVATFVGYRIAGVVGAALSTTGVVFPAFLVILLIAMGMRDLLKTEQARWILNGMKSAIIGFLLIAAYSLYSVIDSPKKIVVSLAAASFVLVFLGMNPFLLIILFALLGFILGRSGLM
jgi:chromate transporter